VSYLGLNPKERSSGGKQRTSTISKQGNTMMRWLLVEAAQTGGAVRSRTAALYQRLKFRRGRERGQSGHRAQTGREVVLDAARHSLVRAAGLPCQGSSRGTLVPQAGSSF